MCNTSNVLNELNQILCRIVDIFWICAENLLHYLKKSLSVYVMTVIIYFLILDNISPLGPRIGKFCDYILTPYLSWSVMFFSYCCCLFDFTHWYTVIMS